MKNPFMNNADKNFSGTSLKIAVSNKTTTAEAVSEVSGQLKNNQFSFILVFFSPSFATPAFPNLLKEHFPDTPIYGCSTAGEITPSGSSENSMVAMGFLSSDFGMKCCFFPELKSFSIRNGQAEARDVMKRFQESRDPLKSHCFALMLVDGLCYREEQLVSAVNYGLKDIPLIGGSAGDGLHFEETFIINNGVIEKDCAVLLLIESRPALHIFKSDSFVPTPVKFVVTKADPENRIVHELNAMPATKAYAKAIGIAESELDLLSFASHPLCVCFGGDCYVRSIKDMHEDGSFSFYCAIDEGIVFTLSDIGDMVAGIEQTFATIQQEIGQPQLILGFDCVLRRMMAEINQSKGKINQLFRDNRVIGFNTYGEQVHAMHLNQTFSGIAIGK